MILIWLDSVINSRVAVLLLFQLVSLLFCFIQPFTETCTLRYAQSTACWDTERRDPQGTHRIMWKIDTRGHMVWPAVLGASSWAPGVQRNCVYWLWDAITFWENTACVKSWKISTWGEGSLQTVLATYSTRHCTKLRRLFKFKRWVELGWSGRQVATVDRKDLALAKS